MSATVTLQGSAKSFKFYNLNALDIEVENYDLGSKEDLKELYEIVKDFVEEGEAQARDGVIELNCLSLDDCYFAINEQEESVEELKLKNTTPKELLKELKSAKVGDIFCIYTLEGEGRWDIEIDAEHIKPSSLNVDYIDCSDYDESKLLNEEYLDLICDSVLPDNLKIKGKRSELKDFYIDPTQSYMELFKVLEIDGFKMLEKIDGTGRILAGTDFIVDDFEEN